MRAKVQEYKRGAKPIRDLDARLYADSTRRTQKSFIRSKLQTLRKMSPSLYSEIVAQPTVQYFLATLCDLKVSPADRMRLGLRYANTPQVQRLLVKLKQERCAAHELSTVDPNAIITTLKEILSSFPGGIFSDVSEEFLCVSLQCSLQTTLIYVNGLIDALPYFLRQFTYLICRSLKNLISQSAGTSVDAYTDALLLFTPALFPNSVGDLSRFLRATRICLVLIDLCDFVFRPFLAISFTSSVSDEEFFRDIVCSLSRLHEWLSSEDESEEVGEVYDDIDTSDSFAEKFPNNSRYYQITYLFD